jgi:predicted transcriptional regulator
MIKQIIIRKVPILLLNSINGDIKSYRILSRITNINNAYTHRLCKKFKEMGLIEVSKKGRNNITKLTKKGIKVREEFFKIRKWL